MRITVIEDALEQAHLLCKRLHSASAASAVVTTASADMQGGFLAPDSDALLVVADEVFETVVPSSASPTPETLSAPAVVVLAQDEARIPPGFFSLQRGALLFHGYTDAELQRVLTWLRSPGRIAGDAQHAFCMSSSEPLIGRVADLLSRQCFDKGTGETGKALRLGFDEALRNAYEHGSLGIPAEEKARACASEEFETLLHEREAIARGAGKLIGIEIAYRASEWRWTVTDAGAGFDWVTLLSAAKQSTLEQGGPLLESLQRLRGRGLLLTVRVFDEVYYNQPGNAVTLVKRFPSRG
ncbi:MAG: ATP-binding protein [Bdellovibrionales bacterium]|nr:ATP-binding protein [Bdellovibrionales bacterium]